MPLGAWLAIAYKISNWQFIVMLRSQATLVLQNQGSDALVVVGDGQNMYFQFETPMPYNSTYHGIHVFEHQHYLSLVYLRRTLKSFETCFEKFQMKFF